MIRRATHSRLDTLASPAKQYNFQYRLNPVSVSVRCTSCECLPVQQPPRTGLAVLLCPGWGTVCLVAGWGVEIGAGGEAEREAQRGRERGQEAERGRGRESGRAGERERVRPAG